MKLIGFTKLDFGGTYPLSVKVPYLGCVSYPQENFVTQQQAISMDLDRSLTGPLHLYYVFQLRYFMEFLSRQMNKSLIHILSR